MPLNNGVKGDKRLEIPKDTLSEIKDMENFIIERSAIHPEDIYCNVKFMDVDDIIMILGKDVEYTKDTLSNAQVIGAVALPYISPSKYLATYPYIFRGYYGETYKLNGMYKRAKEIQLYRRMKISKYTNSMKNIKKRTYNTGSVQKTITPLIGLSDKSNGHTIQSKIKTATKSSKESLILTINFIYSILQKIKIIK